MLTAGRRVPDVESIYEGDNFTVMHTAGILSHYKPGHLRQQPQLQLHITAATTIINNCHSIYNGALQIHILIDIFITLAINNTR